MRNLATIIAAMLSVTLPQASEAQDLDRAERAYKAGDYLTALRELRPLAEQGDARAQFGLGTMYENGLGVPQDYAEAVRWYRLAAEQGFKKAQYQLGLMYHDGLGVPQDLSEASRWYELAAAQGMSKATRKLIEVINTKIVSKFDVINDNNIEKFVESHLSDAGTGRPVSSDIDLTVMGTGNVFFHGFKSDGISKNLNLPAPYKYITIFCTNRNTQNISSDPIIGRLTNITRVEFGISQKEGDPEFKLYVPICDVKKNVTLPQAAEAQAFDRGLRAYSEGDMATALKEWLPLAEQGDRAAQNNLGRLYDYGLGVTQNFTEALRWYRLAAEQGLSFAQAAIGFHYSRGEGVPQNYELAYTWFNLAASNGNLLAGTNGIGSVANLMPPEAIKRAQRPVNVTELLETTLPMSAMLQDFDPTLAEAEEARLAFESSAGYRAYLKRDYITAIQEWRPLAELGDTYAQIEIGRIYEEGRGVAQNYSEAVRWYRLAAELGEVFGQFYLGQMYERGHGVDQNHTEAVRLYRLAAEHATVPFVHEALGRMYGLGHGVPQNYQAAYMWFNLAAAQGGENKRGRDKAASLLTPSELNRAQQMSQDCFIRHYRGC